ncbi:hypothetical protein [Jatrophihabitans sp.]|uniref:hypothetical protein n=1 Tax=Jatrophihabitans sp. TaxID=1932789 RepID=UPI0030C6EAF6|nr:hypothetical protein [Jatrophihabitans sp.]
MNVEVSGGASAEEVSVVLALLSARPGGEQPSGYELWRRTRLQALRDGASRPPGRAARFTAG